jgi:hypothetical protein
VSTLESASFHPLDPGQRRVLALMEVDVYLRRHLPGLAQGSAPAVASPRSAWSEADCALPLARAIARAGGMADAAAWSAAWLQAGRALPDLAELRTAAARRALWRQMRAHR